MEKYGKITSCHCRCMTGISQGCKHNSAAIYGIAAAID